MKVTNEINIYEINGVDTNQDETLKIESHWNRDTLVVLHIDGNKIAVAADQLKKAIENATNHK